MAKIQDPIFSKNRCYISKLNMFKKNETPASVKIAAFSKLNMVKKNNILPLVKIGTIFQNSTWLKKRD